MLTVSATVLRKEGRITLPAAQLVPEDRVVLAAGDRIPADLRLTSVQELRIDESPLTGESSPVEKRLEACEADCPLSERSDMAFSGTFAVYGRAEGIVIETGPRTELGKINAMLSAIPDAATPLTRQINRFGQHLAVAILPGSPDTRAGSQSRPPENGSIAHGDIAEGFTLLGLVGIMDPPRPEARPAVEECHMAGIGVKMFTGDHLATARSIGARIGIGLHAPAVEGAHLSQMTPPEFRAAALASLIFARTSPEDKLRLVQALRAAGQIVAMTGDGVNDPPALKQADVGVVMGVNDRSSKHIQSYTIDNPIQFGRGATTLHI